MERQLDPAADYVITTPGLYAGQTLVATHEIKIVDEPARPGEFTKEQAEQLLLGGRIQLASEVRPTPVERPEDGVLRLADVEAMEGGKFLIRAPWLPDQAEIVSGGIEKATARYEEVVALGLEAYNAARETAAASTSIANADAIAAATIAGNDGFQMIEAGSNGYYLVSGPNGEPETVRGKGKAEERLAELRAEAATSAQTGTVDRLVELGAAAAVPGAVPVATVTTDDADENDEG